jgi:hypothetical protein
MARMKTLVRHTMNQRQKSPGDIYEADEDSAKIAEALGWCERAPAHAETQTALAGVMAERAKRPYRRRVMTTATS